MTILELIGDHLENCGLLAFDAGIVVAALVPTLPEMKGRWEDEATGYPPPLLATLVTCANQQAVKWIDANVPQHWARPMFTGEELPR